MKPSNPKQKPSLAPTGFTESPRGSQSFLLSNFPNSSGGDKWASAFAKGDLPFGSIIALLQMDDGQIEMAAAAA